MFQELASREPGERLARLVAAFAKQLGRQFDAKQFGNEGRLLKVGLHACANTMSARFRACLQCGDNKLGGAPRRTTLLV